jgi:hypothetical protein
LAKESLPSDSVVASTEFTMVVAKVLVVALSFCRLLGLGDAQNKLPQK